MTENDSCDGVILAAVSLYQCEDSVVTCRHLTEFLTVLSDTSSTRHNKRALKMCGLTFNRMFY